MYSEIIDSITTDSLHTVKDSIALSMNLLDSPESLKEILYANIQAAMTNDFFQGGLLLGALAWIGLRLKSIPIFLWNKFLRAIKYTVYIDDTDPIYYLFNTWFSEKYPDKFKNVVAEIHVGHRSMEENERYKIALKQNIDWNWFFYKGSLIISQKQRQTLENASYTSSRYIHSYILTSFVSRKGLTSMLEELRLLKIKESRNKSSIYYNNTSGWCALDIENIKSFDNIFLENKEELVEDLERFKVNKPSYQKLGINSKRGYLFHGLPGNGKTSLALAMSAYLDMDLYLLNLKDVSSDSKLKDLIAAINKDSIIVFEDIDSFAKDRMGEKDKLNVSFSTLLNTLNGALEPNNCIIVMTTNHIEVLDPALKRPGRIDKILELKNPSVRVMIQFMEKFYPEFSRLSLNDRNKLLYYIPSDSTFNLSMSAFQDLCLSNPESDGYIEVFRVLAKLLHNQSEETIKD